MSQWIGAISCHWWLSLTNLTTYSLFCVSLALATRLWASWRLYYDTFTPHSSVLELLLNYQSGSSRATEAKGYIYVNEESCYRTWITWFWSQEVPRSALGKLKEQESQRSNSVWRQGPENQGGRCCKSPYDSLRSRVIRVHVWGHLD